MTYTLFVDESGDFDSFDRRAGWVVAGVLCPGKRGAAEKTLEKTLVPIAKGEGLYQAEAIHVTRLRETWGDHARVGSFAERLLDAASKEGGQFVAVVNRSETRMSVSERTYRLMVLDLLALVDAVAPADLDRLDLVIAQRKEWGAQERMSSTEDLLADVIGGLQDSVEVGLAARGLLDRLDDKPFVVWKAAESWALGVADAVANLTFNRRHVESGGVLEGFRERGLYRDFEAFGDYPSRRAQVAERDGDLGAATVRWAVLPQASVREEALDRVWGRALRRGVSGPTATLEGAIELLWRTVGRDERAAALESIEGALVRAGAPVALVYRVRDLLQMEANRAGDFEEAARLQGLLEEEDAAVASDPATLPLVLKSLFHRMTTAELSLDAKGVLVAAEVHAGVVDHYGAVVALLREEMGVGETGGLETSRLWVKARTSLARGLILVGREADLERATTELDTLLGRPLAAEDRLRAACYRLWVDLRAGRHEEALVRGHELLETEWAVGDHDRAFALAFGARAASDTVVLGGDAFAKGARAVLETIRPAVPDATGFPYDLLWRDVATLEAMVGRGKSAARRGFELARTALGALAPSPVTTWKRYGVDLYEAAVLSPEGPPPEAPSGLGVSGRTAGSAALEYRKTSPY